MSNHAIRNSVFFDTNILVYFFGEEGPKAQIAEKLLLEGGLISVQVLNELVALARGKLNFDWARTYSARDLTLVFCPDPLPLTLSAHQTALDLSARYGFKIYDSMVIASALEAGCTNLYSEDMQHGQTIDKLTIVNPFLNTAMP